ncbi:3-hydroxyacyl-CoA dehydrogenase/enoyl-CoA hydratase family protein [Vampirovibrio sp.]|uniref:3-hydroxyacyl-CoA dehydrogenase/enoyl-CoA hydratase family protein n=1 Tax=Vampirovibrio sp. TaxID=2717857 RepID=UPI003593A83E
MTEIHSIKKAAVIGAGAMGSGIAAQLANAGVQVYLLDIVPQDNPDRNWIANNAIQRMLKATPATDPLNAGLMIPDNARRITTGNLEDHLAEAVRDADWVVEVIVENLEIKQALYAKLETLCKPEAILSSNTSTIPLKALIEGRSMGFKQRFVITHFFNPPRFMHLLEIVTGPETDAGIADSMREFGDSRLGKNVVICKDTPAFLANRIGIYFMFRAITEAIETHMNIEDVDAILGKPIGYPKEGIFGLLDLVGIGIIPLVTDSLLKTLPANDAFRKFDHEKGLTLVGNLLKDGCSGRNSPKGGFYRMQKNADGSKQKQAVQLHSREYYPVEKSRLACVKSARKYGPKAMYETDDRYGRFAWVVVRDTLLYAASLIPEIADDIADVDAALRGGYNAHWGPFEQIDQVGVAWFCERLKADGIELPPVLQLANNRQFYRTVNGKTTRLVFDFENNRADYVELPARAGCLNLGEWKHRQSPLVSHYSASLWDIGDGVTCLEFHSKMNTLDPSVLRVVNDSVQFMIRNASEYKAMVIYNEEKNFSLGANLGLIDAGFQLMGHSWIRKTGLGGPLGACLYQQVEALIYQGQSVFSALRNAPFPVVGAPKGMAIGGGCEILLHCDALQANAETYMGLVESGVGLIPGWGGCARYLERAMREPALQGGVIPPVRKAFQAILMPQVAVSTSGQDARQKLWLGPEDGITMNPDRLLADAKAKALAMAEGYQAPSPVVFRLPGAAGKAALRMAIDDFYAKGDATWHDVVVADALADVLTGGDTHSSFTLSENDVLQLEREHFLSLIRTEQTQKRIAHTLKAGKPLREDPAKVSESLDALRAMRKPKRLGKRHVSGQPLTGVDALQLNWMAGLTAFLLKKVAP